MTTGTPWGRRAGFGRSYGAVLRRELHSLAVLPQTYVIAAAYIVVSGVFFVSVLGSQGLPDLERFSSNIAATLVVVVPIIAMRGLAEERATGTLDLMLSWPLSRLALVLAKFTAHVAVVWILLSTNWIYLRILSRYGTVELGKQVAGFIGLMALAAAFCAVALAISARSASVAGGAFVAVLVLLAGWSLQYVEHWPLGEALAGLSPARRLESALQGVLYPSDLVYFMILVVVGLGVTLTLLDRQRGLSRVRSARRLALVATTTFLVSIVIAAGSSLSGQIDLTPTRRFTLTATSKDIARAIKQPVALSAFVDPDSAEAVQVRNLYRRYRAAGVDMSLDMVDPDRQPARMKELGVTGYGQLLVRIGDRQQLVDHFGEIALTTAIYRVGRAHVPRACFTIGHGERSIADDGPDGYRGLAATLQTIGYETRSIALVAPGGTAELSECDVVVVPGGTGLFEPEEIAGLQRLLDLGGRMLVLTEGADSDTSPLNQLLAGFGVEFRPGTVHDVASLAGDPGSVLAHEYPSEHTVTGRLAASGLPTLVVGGQEIFIRAAPAGDSSGTQVTRLLQTTDRAWVGSAADQPARRTLAVAVDRSAIGDRGGAPTLHRTRVGVVGSVDVGANRFLGRFSNQQFLSALVQWSADEAEIVRASRDPGGVRRIELTNGDQRDIVRRAVVLPVLAVVAPLPIMVRRLRRG